MTRNALRPDRRSPGPRKDDEARTRRAPKGDFYGRCSCLPQQFDSRCVFGLGPAQGFSILPASRRWAPNNSRQRSHCSHARHIQWPPALGADGWSRQSCITHYAKPCRTRGLSSASGCKDDAAGRAAWTPSEAALPDLLALEAPAVAHLASLRPCAPDWPAAYTCRYNTWPSGHVPAKSRTLRHTPGKSP